MLGAEGSFIEAIRNEKQFVIVCERVQREFAITFASGHLDAV